MLPIFKDFDKSAADILNEDFSLKSTLKTKNETPFGVIISTATDYKGGKAALPSKISAKWAHASGFTLDKLEFANDGSMITETSLVNVAPGVKLEFKGSDQMKGDLGVIYKMPNATVTGEISVIDFKSCRGSFLSTIASATIGGAAELSLANKTPELASFNLGASYVMPKLFFGLRTSQKLDVSGLVSYKYADNITLASAISYSTKSATTDVTVGGLYYCAPNVGLKLKATNGGIISASAKQVFGKAFSVVGAAEVNVKDVKDIKFGVTASLDRCCMRYLLAHFIAPV